MSAVLGIDFGTTNTAAAWVDDHNRLQVVPVKENSNVLPSVVCFHGNGSVLVGASAREFIVDDPKNTIFGVKRFLGRRFLSDFVGRHRSRYVFELIEGDDSLTAASVHGRVVSLEEVAFQILSRIVELANIAQGEPFAECVISVPAHYTYRQRQVIRRVAERLLTVKAMVNEPTAAALYYAKGGTVNENVLVYDLGGGTFDATVLRLREGVVEVLATGGDAFLGGQDFDHKIVEHLLEKLHIEQNIDLSGDMIVSQRLAFAAEQAKIDLSQKEQAHLRVPCLAMDGDRFVDLDTTLTRAEMEAIVAPLVERTLGLSEQIVDRAGLTPQDLKEVVLVGGQTNMPSIRRRLGQIFPLDERRRIDPSLAVAVGAALLGKGAHGLVDVLSVPIGLQVPGMAPVEAVPRNVALPCVRRVPVNPRPGPGQPMHMVFYESVDITSIDRDIIGQSRVEPGWLEQNAGDLALEVRMSSSFVLQAYLHAADGGRLPLEIGESRPKPPVEAPRPSTGDVAVARGEARIATGGTAGVRVGPHFQLCSIANLSRSGVFVLTDQPFAVGGQATVELDVGGSKLSLPAQVARAGADEGGGEGMGLRFFDVAPATQRALDEYLLQKGVPEGELDEEIEIDVDGFTPPKATPVPGEAAGGAPVPADPAERIRVFLTGVSSNNLYDALSLDPLSSDAEVRQRITELRALFDKLMSRVSSPLRARLKTASTVLERTTALLTDPRRRLEYDFRCGHTHAEERIQQAGGDANRLTLLREAWHRAHPEKVDKAAIHTAYAMRQATAGDLPKAASVAEEALRLDPFNTSLRASLQRWRAGQQ